MDTPTTSVNNDIASKSIEELAKEVIQGKYGNGDARKKALGSKYDEVQVRVNEILKESLKKFKKISKIMVITFLILTIIFIIWFILEFKEMLNDHRCYNLPLNEFYQDKKCERYWDFKEWKNK